MAIRIFPMGALGHYNRAPIRLGAWQGTPQSGSITATSQQSAALPNGADMVCIQADEACHVAFGSNPIATTSDFKIQAGETVDFGTDAGAKIAWIAGT